MSHRQNNTDAPETPLYLAFYGPIALYLLGLAVLVLDLSLTGLYLGVGLALTAGGWAMLGLLLECRAGLRELAAYVRAGGER